MYIYCKSMTAVLKVDTNQLTLGLIFTPVPYPPWHQCFQEWYRKWQWLVWDTRQFSWVQWKVWMEDKGGWVGCRTTSAG